MKALDSYGVLFEVESINKGSDQQILSQFRAYKGDAFFVLDSQLMLGGAPKFNAVLSAFKDVDLTDQSIIIDPLPGSEAKLPLFVQIVANGDAEVLTYRIEATIGLLQFQGLWGSPTYKRYALATGQDHATPEIRQSHEEVMDACIVRQLRPM